MRSSRILLPLLALLAAAPAAAQSVHGTLSEPSGSPAPRVLVALVDASGHRVAQTLTDVAGEFTVRAPAAGRYSLRAERIGYTAVTSAAFDLAADETRSERMVASGQPVSLQGITVSAAARRCAVRPGAGLATATLWDEARKALSAAALGQSERLFRYDVTQWTRELSPETGAVLHETRRAGSGLSQLPFQSPPAAELSRMGYIRHLPGDSVGYWGPDAAVLLSDEFVTDHCMRVVDGPEPALVGLAFEPVRNRNVPDIRGTLWLDRRTSELRRVEYRYTGGPPESENPRVGGTVEFDHLGDGPWIVRRWSIRMPQVRVENTLRAVPMDLGGGGQSRSRATLLAVYETGGEVTNMATSDGQSLIAGRGPPVVRGMVWDSTRAAPLAGARVYLSGTAAEAHTGADGAFLLRAPGDGSYTVAFEHPDLGPLAASARPQTVSLEAGDTAAVALAVRGWASTIPELCADTALRLNRGIVLGRLTGERAQEATVTASWWYVSSGSRLSTQRSGVATRPDAQGFYVLCGVADDALVTVRAQAGLLRAQGEVRAPSGRPARMDLAMAEMTSAQAVESVTERRIRPDAGETPAATPRSRTMEVIARDVSGAALPGARVRLGILPEAITDAEGRARLSGLPAGTYRVTLSHASIGAREGTVTLPAAAGDVEVSASGPEGSKSLSAVAHATVQVAGVEGRARTRVAGLEAQGFYARKERLPGVFLTDAELDAHPGQRLTDALRRVAGIRMVRYFEQVGDRGGQRGSDAREEYRIASSRGSTGIDAGGPCWMDVYLDGRLVQSHDHPASAQNLDNVELSSVQGVEVYRGSSEVPSEYRSSTSACGVVLLWTRH